MGKGYRVSALSGQITNAETGAPVPMDEAEPAWMEYRDWLEAEGELEVMADAADPDAGDPPDEDGGEEVRFSEDMARTSTTSTKWREKLVLEVLPTRSGNFLLGWQYCWNLSSSSSSFFCEVQDAAGQVLFSQEEEPKDTTKTQRLPVSGFCRVTAREGVPMRFALVFRSGSSLATASMEQARLSLAPL